MKAVNISEPDEQPKPFLAVGKFQSYKILFTTNHAFRRFWLAGVISQLGNWFNYIAIFVLLTKLTGSGGAVSWFLIAKSIPTTFLGPAFIYPIKPIKYIAHILFWNTNTIVLNINLDLLI